MQGTTVPRDASVGLQADPIPGYGHRIIRDRIPTYVGLAACVQDALPTDIDGNHCVTHSRY